MCNISASGVTNSSWKSFQSRHSEFGLWTSDWLLVQIHEKMSTRIENKHLETSNAICPLNVRQDLGFEYCFLFSFSSNQIFIVFYKNLVLY